MLDVFKVGEASESNEYFLCILYYIYILACIEQMINNDVYTLTGNRPDLSIISFLTSKHVEKYHDLCSLRVCSSPTSGYSMIDFSGYMIA